MIGDEPVAVVLPDVILDEYSADLKKDNLHEMLRRFDTTGISQIMVEPILHNDIGNYGIADCQGYELQPVESALMVNVIEKPTLGTAPSSLPLLAAMCYPPIFSRH